MWSKHPVSLQVMTVKDRFQYGLSVTGVLFLWYLGVGWWTADAAYHTLPIFIDEWVGFSPMWLLVYLYMYPQTACPLFSFVYHRSMIRWLLGGVIVYLAATLVWLMFPVVKPMMDLQPKGVLEYWIWVVYQLDPPTNCFPSMHVALSFYGALTTWKMDRKLGGWLLLGVLGIWYATMAIKQHWFVDGAFGIFLVLVADYFCCKKIPWLKEERQGLPRKQHLWWFLPTIFLEISLCIGGMIYWS